MITPEEAQKITKEELQIVDKLENLLDEGILKNSKNKITHHYLNVPAYLESEGPIGHRVLDEIENRYSSSYEVHIDCNKIPTFISLNPKK